MKLVLFQTAPDGETLPGALTADGQGVVSLAAVSPAGDTAQQTMEAIIDGFDSLKPRFEQALAAGPALPLDTVRLRPPLPRPSKVINCIGNYWEHAQREPRPLNMFIKNPDAVIGPGDTLELPDYTVPWMFMHEAELAVVIKGPAKNVSQDDWRSAVFGYTGFVDGTGRGEGRTTWGRGTWLGKSFDTFCPIGPCIATADEVPDPHNLWVQFWDDDQLRHNYSTDDMEHRIPELIAYASRTMTLRSGDLIACGTNHEGLGPIQDGETLRMLIHGIGEFSVRVHDPLKRTWERGIYMGADSTNHEAVLRHRPQDADKLLPVSAPTGP